MPIAPPDYSRIILTSGREAHGTSSRTLAREVVRGRLERIRPGVLRPVVQAARETDPEVRATSSRRRFLDEVLAAAVTRQGRVVVSHSSAVAVLGLPHFGSWPDWVDLLDENGGPQRSSAGLRSHRVGFAESELLPWGEFWVTNPARTVADLARHGDFLGAVVALDFALSAKAPVELRLTTGEVLGILESMGGTWGMTRARTAIEFADGRADNPGESASRVAIHRLGFPAPQLQVPHRRAGGGRYVVDFEWPVELGLPRPLLGEFDGRGKYLRPEMLRGMAPGDAVVAEKRREDELRRQGNDVVRWGMEELADPTRRLRPILIEAGLRPRRI